MTEFGFRRPLFTWIFTIVFVFLVFETGTGQKLSLTNDSKYVGSGNYNWRVYVLANKSVLDSIRYVEYTLHPTFPNPVRRINTRTNNFSLRATGWGEFNIVAKVVFKNNQVANFNHWLRLGSKNTVKDTSSKLTYNSRSVITTKNTSQYVGDGRYDWTVYLVSDDSTLNEIKCVEYVLHPTFPNPVRNICEKGLDRRAGFFLSSNGWGTFKIGVKIHFKNGEVRYLDHQLTFSSQ